MDLSKLVVHDTHSGTTIYDTSDGSLTSLSSASVYICVTLVVVSDHTRGLL